MKIQPNTFLSSKKTLQQTVKENPHENLLLSDARRLLKINVNVTRKIYDFLMKRGLNEVKSLT